MKKLLAIILLVCMLGVALISCAPAPAETGNGGADTTPPANAEELPTLSGKTYDGQTFNALMACYGASKLSDFAETNENGYGRVASAIYKRNEYVQELYKIDIVDTEKFGTSTGNGVGYNEITRDFTSDTFTYDVCMVGTLDAAQLAIGGYLYDLNSLPYVDLTKSWWDQNANEGLMIHNKMFYTTGDISVVDNIATHCILFNKKVAAEKNVNDLYDLVKGKKWTYDKFLEYIKLVTEDVDGNDVMNELDKYGLLCWNDVLQASLVGSEVRLATINDSGEMQLTLYNEKTVDLMTELTEVFNNGKYVYNYTTRNMVGTQSWQTYDKERDGMFSEDRCLFYGMTLNAVPRYRDSETLDFGILPYPKYNEEQESYGSYVGASYSAMLCVEWILPEDKEEFVGTVIESLAYDSKRLVTPEYYEQTLKGRYLKDEESWEMLDIIFAQRCFDVGMYYKIPQANPLTQQITAIIANRENGTFASRYEATKQQAISEIGTLNDMWYKFS